MYDTLTTAELTVLQRILYEGTEEAYRVTRSGDEEPGWTAGTVPSTENSGTCSSRPVPS